MTDQAPDEGTARVRAKPSIGQTFEGGDLSRAGGVITVSYRASSCHRLPPSIRYSSRLFVSAVARTHDRYAFSLREGASLVENIRRCTSLLYITFVSFEGTVTTIDCHAAPRSPTSGASATFIVTIVHETYIISSGP